MSGLTIARFLSPGTLFAWTTVLVVGKKGGENIPVHSFQRAAEDMLQAFGQCAEEDLMYCPYNYTFQLSATEKTTTAEIAFCKTKDSICPKKLNTSSLFHGCSDKDAIGCGIDAPNQCKAVGSSCLNKKEKNAIGSEVFLNCCHGRLITKTGKKIQVGATCNEKTKICEPRFGLNIVCGDEKKDYLECFSDTEGNAPDTPRCGHFIEPRSDLLEVKSPIVTRGNSQLTPGNYRTIEPRRCVENDPCGSMQPVKILCGIQLPDRYEDFPFCECPSPDAKTGYHCVDKVCKSCKLHGVNCTRNSECCIRHTCVNGKCVQCFLITYSGKTNCNQGKLHGNCCDGGFCKFFQDNYFCSKKPELNGKEYNTQGSQK